MQKSFLQFVAEQKAQAQNKQIITEAFRQKDVDKAMDIIDEILKKHINNLVPLAGFVNTTIDNEECISKQFLKLDKRSPYKSSAFQLNWRIDAKSAEVYSIDFFKDASDVIWQGKGKSDLSIKTMGSSVVRFLPIIWTVMNSKSMSISEKSAIKASEKIFKDETSAQESLYYIGALKYHVFEGLSDNIIKETFAINENHQDVMAFKAKKRAEAMDAQAHRNDSPEAKEKSKQLWAEYKKVLDAIRGGIDDVETIQLAISANGSTVIVKDPETIKAHETEVRKDPDQVFKEMRHYIKMVMTGIQPSLIICGAPGVGKTFKVKQQLRAGGYEEGKNMSTIKGKCTPRRLYVELYDFKKPKDILVIDDADALVGPHAPEESINILKAALDSTADDQGRLVNYGIAGKLTDDDGLSLPKKFYYNGGIIVMTNYRAGQLDTALRGRSFIQDIDFTNEEVLAIIKKLLPDIEPQLYSMEAKIKAYDYLVKLNEQGSDMELSLRTFGLCAKMYQTAAKDDTFTEEDVESMITEQMKMQSMRGGVKY